MTTSKSKTLQLLKRLVAAEDEPVPGQPSEDFPLEQHGDPRDFFNNKCTARYELVTSLPTEQAKPIVYKAPPSRPRSSQPCRPRPSVYSVTIIKDQVPASGPVRAERPASEPRQARAAACYKRHRSNWSLLEEHLCKATHREAGELVVQRKQSDRPKPPPFLGFWHTSLRESSRLDLYVPVGHPNRGIFARQPRKPLPITRRRHNTEAKLL